jgi:hypothetical protein
MVKRIKKVPPHVLWRRLARHGNFWWASQFMGALWVCNTERGHGRQKNWALCHWAWLGGANSLKGPSLPLCSENKRKKGGSFGSVIHGKRAWQTKEMVRKEPYAYLHMTIFCHSSVLAGTGELPTLQVCRGSNLHKDNDGWANCRPVSADLLYTTLDAWCTQVLVIGPGQFQDKQPREPKSEPITKNLLLENSNIA